MTPEPNTQHVEQAKALLTSMFKDREVIEGLLTAFVARLQTFEGWVWSVINFRNLDSGFGRILDLLGAIVGEQRNGLGDEDYREAIRLRVLINRSTGKVVEVLKIVSTAAQGAPWTYAENAPASFSILFGGTVARLRALSKAVRASKLKGTQGTLYYAAGPFSELFRPSTVYGVATLARGPADYASGLPAYPPVHVESI